MAILLTNEGGLLSEKVGRLVEYGELRKPMKIMGFAGRS